VRCRAQFRGTQDPRRVLEGEKDVETVARQVFRNIGVAPIGVPGLVRRTRGGDQQRKVAELQLVVCCVVRPHQAREKRFQGLDQPRNIVAERECIETSFGLVVVVVVVVVDFVIVIGCLLPIKMQQTELVSPG